MNPVSSTRPEGARFPAPQPIEIPRARRAELDSTTKATPRSGMRLLRSFSAVDGSPLQPPSPLSLSPTSASAQVPGQRREVQSSEQLTQALLAAQAGDTIVLAAGRYVGPFEVRDKEFLQLEGPKDACLVGENLAKPALTLQNCHHCTLAHFSVEGGQKTLMVKGSSFNTFEDLTLSRAQMEILHLKEGSSSNLVVGCHLHHAGLGGATPAGHGRTQADDGEGIYIGTAKSNNPAGDHSDNNMLMNNTISDTTAENIDIKEFTQSGTISGNQLDGAAGGVHSNAIVEVKGSRYRVIGNVMHHAAGKPGVKNQEVVGAQDSGIKNQMLNNTLGG